MATSGSVSFTKTRDTIITQALRICNSVGEMENASPTQITENAVILNDIIAALQADGMPLWNITQFVMPLVLSQNSYTIGIGGNLNVIPPLKVYQAWTRTTSGGAAQADTPVLVIPRSDFNLLGNKLTPGTPSQIWYDPPGPNQSGTGGIGTMKVFPVPDATTVAGFVLVFTGQSMVETFVNATDTLDFPTYWNNAIVQALAARICRPQGVGLAESAMIKQDAKDAKELAISYGTEEGSIKIQPMPSWNWESYQ